MIEPANSNLFGSSPGAGLRIVNVFLVTSTPVLDERKNNKHTTKEKRKGKRSKKIKFERRKKDTSGPRKNFD